MFRTQGLLFLRMTRHNFIYVNQQHGTRDYRVALLDRGVDL